MLELDQASATIAGKPVLRGIGARIEAGTTVAIVGRNGAGKTTLLRLVMGLVALVSGRLSLDGIDLAGQPARDRVRLGFGYAPEERVLFPTLSVEQNLRFPLEVMRRPRAAIAARLEETLAIVPELRAMLARSAAALSGGQGKMAALGRAVMAGERIVLLDEPFQGLAPVLAAQYGQALRRLQAARPGLAIVITESNRALLHGIAARTLVLERGELVLDPTAPSTANLDKLGSGRGHGAVDAAK